MSVHSICPGLTVELNLAPHLDFSRRDYTGPPIKKLIDVINHVKPTALLGLSTVKVCQGVAKFRGLCRTRFHIGCIRRSSGQAYGCTEPAANHFPVVQPSSVVRGRIQECSRMDEWESYLCLWLPVRSGRVRTEGLSRWPGKQYVHLPRFVQ